jgi:negative regulator of flagellin synthesis FlgM
MNSVDTRPPFFPNSKTSQRNPLSKTQRSALQRNTYDRVKELENTNRDAKVSIPETIKDFSRIKKAADTAPEMDNSAKIASLKQQIANGTYEIDYDALADKMLASEY